MKSIVRHTFKKEERLCSQAIIKQLFEDGESFAIFPFRLVYKVIDLPANVPSQITFSVAKKRIRKAVDRNRIKRIMREVYRLNKSKHYEHFEKSEKQCAMLLMYLGPKDLKYAIAEEKIIRVLKRLIKEHESHT